MPLVLLLFVGSGCAALLYEVVWFQLLSLVIGSTAVSLAVLLGTFMGGMCVGSLACPRFVRERRHPLRVYAALEAGIAVSALLILVGLPYVGGLYSAIGGHGSGGLVLRALLSAICLLPPTAMMGATLPAMARWVETTPRGVAWLGLFYGANTAGAVLGCLATGYYVLREYDVTFATWAGVGVNLVVGIGGSLLSLASPRERADADAGAPTPETKAAWIPPGSWPVHAAIALSGAAAMGAEVVWTRLLSLLLGGTVYTFSLILAAFLIGLAIGGGAGALLSRTARGARGGLGICQTLLVGAILWAAYSLARALPYWPIDPKLASEPTYQFQLDFARCLWVVFPGAFLWGASFPLALAAVASPADAQADGDAGVGRAAADTRDPGRLVGTVYAANTVGGIAGAVGAALVLIPSYGTQQAQRALIAASALAAALSLVATRSPSGDNEYPWRRVLPGAVALAFLNWFVTLVPRTPPELVAWGHNVATVGGHYGDIIFVGEGTDSSMAVSKTGRTLYYHNAGKIQASTIPQDMRLQRMLGHLATLVPREPRNVLVIGCGAGVTAGAVSIDPAVERETIAEIEWLVPNRVAKFFGEANFDVVDNPKVHVQIDDARHFVLTTKETFDAITSDPLDPWVKGAATLYTKEFFELLKEHLNPGGVITVFVQLYESTEDAVKSEVATFLDAFPHGLVFGNTDNGSGYDVVLLGQVEAPRIDIDEVEQRLERPEYLAVKKSLAEIGFESATQLFSTYGADASQLASWLEGAQINRDRNLRLQYLAGLGKSLYQQAQIYSHMIQYRRYPEDVFVGAPEQLSALRATMATKRR